MIGPYGQTYGRRVHGERHGKLAPDFSGGTIDQHERVREHGAARERRCRCGFSTSSKIDGVEQTQNGATREREEEGIEARREGVEATGADHRERRRWAPPRSG